MVNARAEDTVGQSSEDGNILNKVMKRPSQDPRLEWISLRQELASLLPTPPGCGGCGGCGGYIRGRKSRLLTAEKRRGRIKMILVPNSYEREKVFLKSTLRTGVVVAVQTFRSI